MTLDKLLKFLESQSLHLENGDNIRQSIGLSESYVLDIERQGSLDRHELASILLLDEWCSPSYRF